MPLWCHGWGGRVTTNFGGVDVPVQCAMVGGGEGDGRRTLGSKLIASTLSNSFLKFIVPRTKKKHVFF